VNLREYAGYDGLGLADLVRRKEVAPKELAGLALEGIEKVNGELNAVLETFSDERAGLRLEDIPEGAFRGVPFLIKDLVLTRKGTRQESGSALAKGFVADHDSELMIRFRRAGLVTLGRTATPELGLSCTTECRHTGAVRNPWDTSRMTGGSSGGSAASVAAGAVPIAHANDGGGSIRNPASCCGLVGLKPSRGRVPAGPDYGDLLNGLGVEFAVTRTLRDCAALFDAVQGPALGDPYAVPAPERPYLEELARDPGRLRIAFTGVPWSGVPVDADVVEAVERTAAIAEQMGHAVTEASPELDWPFFMDATFDLWCAYVTHAVDAIAGALDRVPSEANLQHTIWACHRYGQGLSAEDLLRTLDALNLVCRSVAPFFQDYDILMTPTCALVPQPLGTYDADAPELDARGWNDHLFSFDPFLPLFNATGQPAISLPLHESREGLPLGVQLVARCYDEATLFRLGARLEEALPWRDQRPGVHVAAG
jgi:amidase